MPATNTFVSTTTRLLPFFFLGLWATVLKKEVKYIGCCGLRAAERGAEAHLGFYLARAYWQQGFASEASKAFIDTAFTRLRLDRFLADVESGNDASEHILQKFGFKYVSREEIPASGRIINLYELLKSDWEKRVTWR